MSYKDKIHFYWYVGGSAGTVECKILGIQVGYNDYGYKVLYDSKEGKLLKFLCIEGEGVVFSDGTEYKIDSGGRLDIKGINEYLYNRKVGGLIDNL